MSTFQIVVAASVIGFVACLASGRGSVGALVATVVYVSIAVCIARWLWESGTSLWAAGEAMPKTHISSRTGAHVSVTWHQPVGGTLLFMALGWAYWSCKGYKALFLG